MCFYVFVYTHTYTCTLFDIFDNIDFINAVLFCFSNVLVVSESYISILRTRMHATGHVKDLWECSVSAVSNDYKVSMIK